MRRWIAVLLLCLASVYLGATGADLCEEGPGDDCAPVCHILCPDGCATVPVPDPPVPPVPDSPQESRFEAERIGPLVNLEIEPEKEPPRG